MDQYIGICQNCNKKGQSIVSLNGIDHQFPEKHQIITIKDLLKRPEIKNILSSGQIYLKQKDNINYYTDKLIQLIQQQKKIHLAQLFQCFLEHCIHRIFHKENNLQSLLQNAIEYNFQIFTCSQMNKLLACIKSQKSRSFQEKACQIYNKFRTNQLSKTNYHNISSIAKVQQSSFIYDQELEIPSFYSHLQKQQKKSCISPNDSQFFGKIQKLQSPFHKCDHKIGKDSISLKDNEQTINSFSKSVLQSYQKFQELSYADPEYKGLTFVRVQKLRSKQYYNQCAKFNIKLKVIKQIIFKETQNHKKKIKFIGGDHTGIILCFVDYIAQIKTGSTILLKNCEGRLFKNKSYEIKASSAEKCKKLSNDSINFSNCLSQLKIENKKFLYEVQALDVYWPSIYGLNFLQFIKGQARGINIIVKIQQIIYSDNSQCVGICSDPTGITNFSFTKTKEKEWDLIPERTYWLQNLIACKQYGGNANQYFICIRNSLSNDDKIIKPIEMNMSYEKYENNISRR